MNCQYCNKFFQSSIFNLRSHEEKCKIETAEREAKEVREFDQDQATENAMQNNMLEFTEVGFTEEQARLLLEKFG